MEYHHRAFQSTVCAVRLLAACVVGLLISVASVSVHAHVLEPMGRLELRYHGWFLIDAAGDTSSDNMINRPEVKARIGFRLKPDFDLIEGELSAVTGDPKVLGSHWQPMAATEDPKTISLDRAWVGVGFDPLPELRFILGRAPTAWSRSGLLWEPELVLPGLWVDWQHQPEDSEGAQYHVNAGVAYIAAGGANINNESTLRGLSVTAQFPIGRENTELTLGLGYFDMSGELVVGQAIARGDSVVATRPAGFTSNTTATDDIPVVAGMGGAEAELTRRLIVDGLASDFNIISGDILVQLDMLEHMPLRLTLHATWNLGADGPGSDHALGLLGGVGFGELNRPGRGLVQVRYLRIAADAALDLFNREHYGTNVEGVEVTGDLIAFEGWTVGFIALYSWQVEPDLRGYGDAPGEPFPGDPTSVRLFATTGYTF